MTIELALAGPADAYGSGFPRLIAEMLQMARGGSLFCFCRTNPFLM